MLTIFSCPKPFSDPHIATIQRNAIRSWTKLSDRCEVLLVGDDEGVAEQARDLELTHIPHVKRNDKGTPLLDSIFEVASEASTTPLMCYINADLILLPDFDQAVSALPTGRPLLMSGGRWDVDLTTELDMQTPEWQSHVDELKEKQGVFSFWGNDYFVFSRGVYSRVPSLAIGRGYFDAWLFSEARARGAIVIDASEVITAVHQLHHYKHINEDQWSGSEGSTNLDMVHGDPRKTELPYKRDFWYLKEATHRMTSSGGLKRIWAPKLRYRAHGFVTYRLGPLRHKLGLRRRGLR